MLHIIKQYRQLFLAFISSNLNNTPDNSISFKDELSQDLDDKELSLDEAKALLVRLDAWEDLKYTKDSAKTLVDSLWVAWTDTWINSKSFKEKLRSIVENAENNKEIIITETKKETSKVKESIEKVINTDIFNRTLKEWSKWSDVMALQDFLVNKWLLSEADGKFWLKTKKALQKFQRSIWYSNPDGVLTVSNKKTYKTLAAIKGLNTNNDYKGSSTNVYGRKANKTEVKNVISKSTESLDALQKLNENSDDFYKALEAYYDGWFRKDILSDMWGILGWLEEIVWANKANDYFDKMKTYEKNIWNKEDKFNEELLKVLPKRKDSNWNLFNEREYSLGWYAIRDIIIMAVFQDIPLLDIRLNFAKNLVSHWVPMDKARALKNWVDNWMEWKPNYSEENLDKISGKDSLKNLRNLRSTLTAYWFSNKQIDYALKGNLKKLTKKQKEVINTIINDRIIPDLETLRIGWFNFIERWFDDKDGEIKNKINKLTWNKYNIGTIKDIVGSWNNYDVTIEKKYNKYILEIDDWGPNSYISFDKNPSNSDIKKVLKEYNNDEWNWLTLKSKWVDYGASSVIWWKENPENEFFNIVKLSDNNYILEKDWKYLQLDHKPKQDEINDYYDNELKWFKVIHNKNDFDNNITIEEKLKLTWEALELLKVQDTEDWFFWTESWLWEGIKRVDSRYEYTKWINEERGFLLKAIEILKSKNTELFKKFSMISTFGTVTDFLNAFPSNDLEIRWFLSSLKTAENIKTYVRLLEQINKSNKVNKYFDIVFNAHKNNNWMNAWKNYRLSNIPKETWLKRINTSNERHFKYGESLDINSTWKDALDKMKSETTEQWWNKPSMNILWNIVSWMILKAWITDITTWDLKNAILDKWESIPLDELNSNVINTAKSRKFSNDQITTFPKLQFEIGDTHAFHTVIEKKIVLYKKNWDKVELNKTYDIYLRPECNNLLIIPWSNGLIEKLNQADFNMDISNLKTKTLPITLMMIKWVIDTLTPNKTWEWASSLPVDWDPITIPTVSNQPGI